MENYITKIHGCLVRDSRISDDTIQTVKDLTEEDIKYVQSGYRKLELIPDNFYIKNLQYALSEATLTGTGKYRYVDISILNAVKLSFEPIVKIQGLYNIVIVGDKDSKLTFEFENNGEKYRFIAARQILLNFGILDYKCKNGTYPLTFCYSAMLDYTNSLNNTEKVLKLGSDVNSIKLVSYKKYTIASGAVSATEDININLWSDHSYTIEKL